MHGSGLACTTTSQASLEWSLDATSRSTPSGMLFNRLNEETLYPNAASWWIRTLGVWCARATQYDCGEGQSKT